MRLFAAIMALAFTFYMIPGLWGAPLKVISAFLPPQQTQDFDLHTSHVNELAVVDTSKTTMGAKKYGDIFEAQLGLDALTTKRVYAKAVNKPVIIDFTGHACVNCRKM